jgi:hypothetical protein
LQMREPHAKMAIVMYSFDNCGFAPGTAPGRLSAREGIATPTRIFLAANNMKELEQLSHQSSEDTVSNANNLVRMAIRNVYGSTNDRREFVERRLRRPRDAPLPGLIIG